ncbi:unnamed protein product, partial [Prorocentrum cordatum]
MALLIAAASLLALAHASGPQASCAVGQQCAAGEQDDTGMLQKSSQMMQVNRHDQMSVRTTPTNDAECQAVKGINTGLPIVYDSSCPGLCCFEDQPCRYNNTGCYSAALAQQKVRTTPTNDAECEAVPGTNTDEPIVHDSSCPGHQHGPAHRLRLQLPRPVLLRGPAVQVQQHRLLLRSFGAAEGEEDAHERRRVQGREGHQHGPAHRLRLQLPRPVLLRGPAVQVQQHGLLLRSPGAAEGEDDAHERRRVPGREGHQHGPAHRLRLQLSRPVLLRGPAVQVQQHGLLLRSPGAAEGEDDAHERRRVQGREGHQHGSAHRLRLQLPRPVLLRGPAVQVQQHGLLLRSPGAAEGEDDAHER